MQKTSSFFFFSFFGFNSLHSFTLQHRDMFSTCKASPARHGGDPDLQPLASGSGRERNEFRIEEES